MIASRRIFGALLLLATLSLPALANADAPPTINSVSPSSGPDTIDPYPTITGSGFETGAKVYVGGRAALGVWQTGGSTELIVFQPPLASHTGAVNIRVVNPDGSTAISLSGFTYTSASIAPPVISSISPSSGPDTISPYPRLSGSNFQAGAKVYVGGFAARSVSQTGTTSLSFQPPLASHAGPVNVEVVNPNGGYAIVAKGFTYTSAALTPPVISSISPNSGPYSMSPYPTITGTGFESGAKVYVDGVAAASVSQTGTTSLSFEPPLVSTIGPVNVEVVNPDHGTAIVANGFTYTTPSGGGGGGGGSTVTPNPAAPGQTMTVNGSLNPGATASNATVYFWLFPTGSQTEIAKNSTMANFTSGQSSTVATTFALPSTLAKGSYTVTAGIYDSAGKQLLFNGDFANFTVAGTSAGGGGSTVTPNPAAAGQTITINGSLNPGVTASNATVYFWLFPTGSQTEIAKNSTTANFTSGQCSTVATTIALPPTLAKGSYTVTSGIYDLAGKQLLFTGNFGSFTVAGTSGGGGGGGGTAPVASFSCTPLNGTLPLTVTCTDSSSNTPTAWSWTFGDSGTNTAQNPSHTYEAVGTYAVTLTASNSAGMDTASKSDYITVAQGGGGGGGKTFKFHPGHYIELDPGSGGGGLSGWLATIASLKGATGVRGVAVIPNWSQLEFAKGVYTGGAGSGQGFDMIDQLLAACKDSGLQLMLEVEDRAFGTARPNAGSYGVLPPYFDTTADSNGNPPLYVSYSTPQAGSLVVTSKVIDPVVTARNIALVQAYGARYDSNPNFELMQLSGETSNTYVSNMGSGGYDQLVTQLSNLAKAARAAFPTTALRISSNFMDTAAQFSNLFNASIPFGIAMGGPDVYLDLPGNPIFPGSDTVVFNGYLDGKSYVNILPFVAEVQQPDENGRATPQQLYDEMNSGSLSSGGSVQPNYWVWAFDASWQGPNAFTNSQILAFIASVNGAANSQRPSSY